MRTASPDTFITHRVFDPEFAAPKYNTVNVLNGYGQIGIYSPLEVIQYYEDA